MCSFKYNLDYQSPVVTKVKELYTSLLNCDADCLALTEKHKSNRTPINSI